MALEKWFYDHSEEPSVCGPLIDRLLVGSDSVAFLGLLCSVGKQRPDYFRDELRPLVAEWRLMVFENEYLSQGIDSHALLRARHDPVAPRRAMGG